MNLNEIIAGGGVGLVVLLTLVQIAPIKINPWSAVARVLGRAINGEVLQRMDAIEKKQDTLTKTMNDHIQVDEEESVKLARTRILRFNDEVLRRVRHTKEHFDEILEDIDRYESYCRTHPNFKNNRAGLAIENIRAKYRHLSDTRGFLGFDEDEEDAT